MGFVYTNHMGGTNKGPLVHGHKRNGFVSPTYKTWLGMKRRCSDPKFKDFAKYGARGISVCERWNSSFVNFLADMGEKPSSDHSIDRINPELGYSPENCRWATSFQQGAENRRSLRAVTIDGRTFPSLSAACLNFGVGRSTLSERLKRGIALEEAITTPTWKLTNRRPRESYLSKRPLNRQRNAEGRFI
jgi:hypothetical protein